ncbi:hypothetical protein ACIQM4_27600 [Streptomyces sp. NPDC091272]|uniref:hypothetical protein n=1 Tax=Streptomyces sp. NPDC091272 TaxID=3365981 RepID=UPI00380FF573
MADAAAVGLDRLVVDPVCGESGQDVVEVMHAERDHGSAYSLSAHVSIVNDDPRVLTDLPQVLLTDDLVRWPPEERLELLHCPGPVTHAHDAVQVHSDPSSESFQKLDHSCERKSSDDARRWFFSGSVFCFQ